MQKRGTTGAKHLGTLGGNHTPHNLEDKSTGTNNNNHPGKATGCGGQPTLRPRSPVTLERFPRCVHAAEQDPRALGPGGRSQYTWPRPYPRSAGGGANRAGEGKQAFTVRPSGTLRKGGGEGWTTLMNNTERWLCLALTLFPLLPGLKRCAFLSHSQTGGLLKCGNNSFRNTTKVRMGVFNSLPRQKHVCFFFLKRKTIYWYWNKIN